MPSTIKTFEPLRWIAGASYVRVAAWALIPLAPAVQAAGDSELKSNCESRTPGGDALYLHCPMNAPAAVADRRYRFKVDFSGGHDDTQASIALSLDGAPLRCDEGSKTSLFGEDGEVSLECRFALRAAAESGAAAAERRLLDVTILWSHAQYTDFQLTPE